jgi:hypothetical protein
MQHSAMVGRNEPVEVFSYTPEEVPYVSVHKVADDGSFSEVHDVFVVQDLGGDYYKFILATPDEDCYLCVLFGGFPTFLRVGDPAVRVLHHGRPGLPVSARQLSAADGSLIGEGPFQELGQGFYTYVPPSEDLSIIQVTDENGVEPYVLRLPYFTETPPPTGTEYRARMNFLRTGYNTFAFLGHEMSRFDLGAGRWVSSDDGARAADLAKAVASRYGLVWGDSSSPDWIGNFIRYLRTYDETVSRFRVYFPATTPEGNVNNFPLVVRDPLGNVQLRGIQMLLSQPLEALPGDVITGAIFDFHNEEED